jgi:NAD(P)-dependent dehydrogenase (short-subunit alcohol dehydrogenase family)
MGSMTSEPVALITGASQGLGRALARSLSTRGWRVVMSGRDAQLLGKLADELPTAVVLRGDVSDAGHRQALAAAVDAFGRLDLLVNNASALGPSPLPYLSGYPVDALRAVYETNVLAPLALTQLLLPRLRAGAGVVLNLSSDAAVEPYEGWGGYGSSKAALDQLSAVLAAEEPLVRVYAVDPGDMRTQMQQDAFPGEDISDRPPPEDSVPGLRALIDGDLPSGRYRASETVAAVAGS